MNTMRKIIVALCVSALIFGAVSSFVFAEEANVTYEGKAGDLIFGPGSEYSPTDLFPDFKNVMPGASLTQKITVCNTADKNVKVKIYLRSLGSADPEYNEFLNKLTLTVTKEADTPLFSAQADKTAGLTDWVCLGTLYSEEKIDLNITLDVPTDLDNMFQKQIGKIKWQFVTEEYPLEDPVWKCPTDGKHDYHIEEIGGITTFVCDDCGKSESMKCKDCGGEMHEAAAVIIGGKTYTVYPDGENHYSTKDGNVNFHLNGEKIIDYYTVGNERIDVKSVSEYTFYTYYECLNNSNHHTDPRPSPATGVDLRIGLTAAGIVTAGSILCIVLLWKRKKNNSDEEARAKCSKEKP